MKTAVLAGLGAGGALVLALSLAPSAQASTPAADAAVERASAAACIRESGLREARVGPVTRFSDRMLIDIRTVTGRWPQPHMNNVEATMLCAYHRRTRRAEAVELVTAPAIAEVRESWWRAEDIGGRGVLDRSDVTLFLGQDGRIGGRSGCNNYSARYQLEGDRLRIFPPLIGTRMACPPALMEQERRYQDLLTRVVRIEQDRTGALVLVTSGQERIRFMPAPPPSRG